MASFAGQVETDIEASGEPVHPRLAIVPWLPAEIGLHPVMSATEARCSTRTFLQEAARDPGGSWNVTTVESDQAVVS
jgi:hypothetical protein